MGALLLVLLLAGDGGVREADALPAIKQLKGPKHPDYAIALSNLAESCRSTGKQDEARKLQQEAVDIGRAALGADHPTTLGLLFNLGAQYSQDGDAARALEICQTVLAGRERMLGATHPETVETRSICATLSRP